MRKLKILFLIFLLPFLLGNGNQSLIDSIENQLSPITTPGTPINEIQVFLESINQKYTLKKREACLRQRWGGLKEKPDWWPEKHWWYDNPIKSIRGGPPCTDGPYIHTRFKMKTINPLISSNVHVYFRFDGENKLIDHRLRTAHTGL